VRGDECVIDIGVISSHLAAVYFAMITLAFAQLIFGLSFALRSISGGETAPRASPTHPFPARGIITPTDSITFYLLTATIPLLILGFGYNSFSPRSYRHYEGSRRTRNERGHSVLRYPVIFVISGTMATVESTLWAFYLRYVTAKVFFCENTGDAVIY